MELSIYLKTCSLAAALGALGLALATGCRTERSAPMTTRFPLAAPDTVTYVGHATVLLRLNGVTILTDPLYAESVAFCRRYVQPGVRMEDLPRLDLILISHSHPDHLNKSTLKQLDKEVVCVVPDGLQKTVRALGFRDVRGLKKWEMASIRGTGVTSVPAQHWGTACGYLVSSGKTVYFAGDTGLFDGMRAIGERRLIDLALLPIGGYRPRLWFIPGLSGAMRRVHMAPEDVPPAAEMLRARAVVPIHWGTFKLTDEPVDEPLDRMHRLIRDMRPKVDVRIVVQGETIAF